MCFATLDLSCVRNIGNKNRKSFFKHPRYNRYLLYMYENVYKCSCVNNKKVIHCRLEYEGLHSMYMYMHRLSTKISSPQLTRITAGVTWMYLVFKVADYPKIR